MSTYASDLSPANQTIRIMRDIIELYLANPGSTETRRWSRDSSRGEIRIRVGTGRDRAWGMVSVRRMRGGMRAIASIVCAPVSLLLIVSKEFVKDCFVSSYILETRSSTRVATKLTTPRYTCGLPNICTGPETVGKPLDPSSTISEEMLARP